MNNKTTIKDIARVAGVSIATVSYVLNDKTEERISAETRKKVLQVINLLNYTPNKSAKELATSKLKPQDERNQKGQYGNLGIYLAETKCPFKQAEQFHFLHMLAQVLNEHDYRLTHLCPNQFDKITQTDAIICYDVIQKDFLELGDNNYVPLLAVDSLINDPLFFQISYDYERILRETKTYFSGADFIFATTTVINEKRLQLLNQLFSHITFVQSIKDLQSLVGKNVLVTEETLYQLLKEDCNLFYQPNAINEKMQKVYECIEFAIDRVQANQHSFLI